jgi:hypothetical protein
MEIDAQIVDFDVDTRVERRRSLMNKKKLMQRIPRRNIISLLVQIPLVVERINPLIKDRKRRLIGKDTLRIM